MLFREYLYLKNQKIVSSPKVICFKQSAHTEQGKKSHMQDHTRLRGENMDSPGRRRTDVALYGKPMYGVS